MRRTAPAGLAKLVTSVAVSPPSATRRPPAAPPQSVTVLALYKSWTARWLAGHLWRCR